MTLQITLLTELDAATFAHVNLRVIVSPFVTTQASSRTKALRADIAPVRFLSRVDQHVLLEFLLSPESSVACIAHVVMVVGVKTFVNVK